MLRWLNRLQNGSPVVRVVLLASTTLAEFALVGPLAVYLGGRMGLAAAAVAAALCLAGAASALIAADLLRGPQSALQALLAGMAFRMGIPLGAGVALYVRGGPLAEAGVLHYLLVFYPVALTIETALSLPRNRQLSRPSQGAQNGAM